MFLKDTILNYESNYTSWGKRLEWIGRTTQWLKHSGNVFLIEQSTVEFQVHGWLCTVQSFRDPGFLGATPSSQRSSSHSHSCHGMGKEQKEEGQGFPLLHTSLLLTLCWQKHSDEASLAAREARKRCYIPATVLLPLLWLCLVMLRSLALAHSLQITVQCFSR